MTLYSSLKEGIDLIDNDSIAERAFRFANQAMWKQRVHIILARKVRNKEVEEAAQMAIVDPQGFPAAVRERDEQVPGDLL